MNCPLLREETSTMLLPGHLDEEVAAHVRQCARCAGFRAEQASVWQALEAWKPAAVSADFNRRLWQRIEVGAAAPWYGQFAGWWKPAIPLVAASLLVIAGFVHDHSAGRTTVPAASAVITVADAEQVERSLDDIQLLEKLDSAAGAI